MFSVGAIILATLLALPTVSPLPLTTNCHTNPNSPLDGRPSFSFAPLLGGDRPHGLINDSYIVVLKKETSVAHLRNHVNFLQAVQKENPLLGGNIGIRHVYDGPINGYTGRFSETAMHQLRSMPEVEYIEHDRLVHTIGTLDIATQTGAPWVRPSPNEPPRPAFAPDIRKYQYDPPGGEGADVYVMDSGINVGHVEFEGRASWGKTLVQDDVDQDQNGHGTHCAGTIASRKYGVAKAATVIAVKVVRSDGYGSMSDIIAGISYVVSSASAKAAAAQQEYEATGRTAYKGSVVNMSLGLRGVSRAGNQAVNGAIEKGIHFVVAAGNDDADACTYTPASSNAITVGASTQNDERAYFSNHGPCVDVFAPGLNVLSTFKGTLDATAVMSGTSMASPHTVGLVAYLLGIYPSHTFDPVFGSAFGFLPPAQQVQHPLDVYALLRAAFPWPFANLLPAPRAPERPDALTPAQMKIALLALATQDKLSGLPANTPNALIFNNASTVA
ncbi:peptidase S8/S53 domain-containing protein [Mycena maculata]|uniref:Peptidase S8/S53 domain-containing protein n=1 Tax=Mycena maculata TaxID=230809 RepID=A0AAD7I8R6_9AGAR|nr:peptidase S8/S53 domain-containing protein [Mycena maculata]